MVVLPPCDNSDNNLERNLFMGEVKRIVNFAALADNKYDILYGELKNICFNLEIDIFKLMNIFRFYIVKIRLSIIWFIPFRDKYKGVFKFITVSQRNEIGSVKLYEFFNSYPPKYTYRFTMKEAIDEGILCHYD